MKGVILAGGLGTRLQPLTLVTNKHLLPVYDRPMIYYPIECLKNIGIKDILIVTGGEHAGDFLKLLKNGKDLGVDLHYTYQDGNGGIADALSLAEKFADGDEICVILGDNIIETNMKPLINNNDREKGYAKIFLKAVKDPERFGVARFENFHLKEVVEKPKSYINNLAVIGIYIYPPSVFDICKTLEPSQRNELEITDVNNIYINRENMLWEDIGSSWWSDAGTFESLHRASILVATRGANQQNV